MPLPSFDEQGDLPVGVHQSTITEVIERFGTHTLQRLKRDLTDHGIVEVIVEVSEETEQ